MTVFISQVAYSHHMSWKIYERFALFSKWNHMCILWKCNCGCNYCCINHVRGANIIADPHSWVFLVTLYLPKRRDFTYSESAKLYSDDVLYIWKNWLLLVWTRKWGLLLIKFAVVLKLQYFSAAVFPLWISTACHINLPFPWHNGSKRYCTYSILTVQRNLNMRYLFWCFVYFITVSLVNFRFSCKVWIKSVSKFGF